MKTRIVGYRPARYPGEPKSSRVILERLDPPKWPTPGHLDALQRECPACKASPGKPCLNTRYTEQVAEWTHLERSATGKSKWRQR